MSGKISKILEASLDKKQLKKKLADTIRQDIEKLDDEEILNMVSVDEIKDSFGLETVAREILSSESNKTQFYSALDGVISSIRLFQGSLNDRENDSLNLKLDRLRNSIQKVLNCDTSLSTDARWVEDFKGQLNSGVSEIERALKRYDGRNIEDLTYRLSDLQDFVLTSKEDLDLTGMSEERKPIKVWSSDPDRTENHRYKVYYSDGSVEEYTASDAEDLEMRVSQIQDEISRNESITPALSQSLENYLTEELIDEVIERFRVRGKKYYPIVDVLKKVRKFTKSL